MAKGVKKLTVRLNQEDYLSLLCQVEKFGKSQNEFIRELIRKSFVEDIKDLNLVLDEIRKQIRFLSNNINQVAKYKHSKILFDEIEESKKIHQEIKKLWELLKW